MRMIRALALVGLSSLAACASSQANTGTAADPSVRSPARGETTEHRDFPPLAAIWRGHAPTLEDPKLTAYVSEVGRRITTHSERPHIDWTFHVLDSAAVNAHAFADRHIAVTRGLLAHMESEAELAAVLAHEVSHVVCRHTQPTSVDWLLEVVESFEPGSAHEPLDERQADQMAAHLLTQTEYAPRAMFEALRSLRRVPSPGQALFHEDASSAADMEDGLLIRSARVALVTADSTGGRWGRARYLREIEGLAVGPEPWEPALRDGRYVIPWAKIAFDIPPGVEATHDHGILSLSHGATGAVVLLTPANDELTTPGRKIAELMSHVEERTVQGIGVRVGDYRGPEKGLGRMAILHADKARFLLFSGGKTKLAVSHSRELHETVLSHMSRRVGPAVAQARLRVVPNDEGPPDTESRGSCPLGTDLTLSAHLNDASSTPRGMGPARVKCAVRDGGSS